MCGHLPAGCVLLSPCSFRSLCFPESVSARMGSGPSQSVIWHVYCEYIIIYIIREEASIFAPQRIPFYKVTRVAACTVGKVRSSTVFMCVCSTFRPSDFLLFVKNGFVVGVRCQGNREPPADSATTPLSH